MAKKRLVVLTGAGISAESGIKTFRDSDGLWEEYRVTDVATPEAWARNPELVQQFYNARRKQLLEVEPNAGHHALAAAEEYFDVQVLTQNIDDLHERAGSTNVLHLHGQLRMSQSSKNPDLVYPIDGWELKMGEKAEDGSQLRPHVVWFGEAVPNIEKAAEISMTADYYAIVGTSLNVYPAAGLVAYAPKGCPVWLVDPKPASSSGLSQLTVLAEPASSGVAKMVDEIRRLADA